MTTEQIDNLVSDIIRATGPEAIQRTVLRSIIRNAISTAKRKPGEQPPMTIETRSIVSGTDYRPVVVIEWADQQGQLSPGEARDFAERVRKTADAAESDAFMFEWITKHVEAGPDAATRMLYEFREYREERVRKDFLP